MKIFLWTTLFWIVVAIAGLLCLGFGNLGTQVLDNGWLASIMPNNLQTRVCDSVVTTAMEGIDWCAAAESHDCTVEGDKEDEVEALTGETAWLQESLSSIIENQEVIYDYLQKSVESLNKSIAELQKTAVLRNIQDEKVDEKQQQRLQLQAQIDALQTEMANL